MQVDNFWKVLRFCKNFHTIGPKLVVSNDHTRDGVDKGKVGDHLSQIFAVIRLNFSGF